MKSPQFQTLTKLNKGDKVAIVSPSFAAPARWPHIYELGLKRLKEDFGLEPVSYPATCRLGASKDERAADLIAAFEDPEIKAVIATIGGNDQVTYVKNLPDKPFRDNPKPYFGYSDNSHFMNHLWLNGVPSYYGGSLFGEFARTPRLDDFTVEYLNKALFEGGELELTVSDVFNDIGTDWGSPDNLTREKRWEPNSGWHWNGPESAEGISWGGCLESIDEMLRHNVQIPSLEQFENIILMTETSEEMPDNEYVHRVYRAFGERGILKKVKGVLVGRPKTWEFGKEQTDEQRAEHLVTQRETILNTVRSYNEKIPVVQNLDFGHTNPSICMPYGSVIQIKTDVKKIKATF